MCINLGTENKIKLFHNENNLASMDLHRRENFGLKLVEISFVTIDLQWEMTKVQRVHSHEAWNSSKIFKF